MTETVERVERTVRPGGIGARALRKEDDRLLRGEGRFTDDVDPAHALSMAVGRCPFPRARIAEIDISAALELEGVRQVLVGADVRRLTEPINVIRPVPEATVVPTYYALAQETAQYEGQPVVSVAATSRHVAEDAVELIAIDYDPLPHVPDVIAAQEPAAEILHPDELSTNLLASNPQGMGDSDAAFAAAATVVEGRFTINRVTGLPMEGRGTIAEWRAGPRELTVRTSTQTPHLVRNQLAHCLRVDEGGVRVIASDIGGAFGLKLGVYPEDLLACLHAMALGRPVKWIEDRLEHFRATTHARQAVHDFRIGADGDGLIVAMEDVYATDLGAYNGPYGSAQLSSVTFTGPYRVADASVERRVVMTSKTPVGAYRGYGQPEVNFAREVLIDRLARRLGKDPLELRAENMLRPEDLPWRNPSGASYDSGDYERCLRMAGEAIGYDDLRAAGRGPRADGRYAGVGMSSFVERTGYAGGKFLGARGSRYGAHESVTLRANRSGGIDLYTGVSTFGQGTETALAQVCSEVLGIDFDAISVHAGDTAGTPLNTGSFASRTMIAASGAVEKAAREMREKVLRIGAWLLDVRDPAEVEVEGSVVRCLDDHDRAVALAVVHEAAILGQGIPDGETPGLESTAHYEPVAAAFGFGTAAAVVSVDAETGDFEVERFVMVHDCGTAVNPMTIEGQVRGALAQGFGAALAEELCYDPDTGQLVNGTMLDYFVPTACDLPPVELLHTEVPSPVTPFGVRGVGEVGTIPPGAAIANAVCDALADFGVEIARLPVTPELVWSAITEAQAERGVA
jgi:aerobic carbon-monoxide dehydrogenase large subunit